ncbi:4-oxalocrotonate tautomerase [Paraburkholderia sp.]|uniref:4-oxalocrotonate tautomerase n=1 Tax=Paraburkholderia sp. TaxID=1926495 RepID=UPI003D6EF9E2
MGEIIACLSAPTSTRHCLHWRAVRCAAHRETRGTAMPVLQLQMHPGRTPEQKRAFVREVTRVAVETLTCPPESVDVIITEVPRDAWAKAGKLLADG